jgi:transposase
VTIIGGLDVHRAQVTFDYVDTATGEVSRGQIVPATRLAFRAWLGARFQGRQDVKLAVEGCTGWRYLVEEMQRAGVEPHLAEPADTAARRGRKKRAKNDRLDARLLRELLAEGRLPESWIPPQHVLEARTRGRTYLAVASQRRRWLQCIQAQLYHEGVPRIESLLTRRGRDTLAGAELSCAGREKVELLLDLIAAQEGKLQALKAELEGMARSLAGPRALDKLYGIGPLTALVIWAELGDCRRLQRSDQAVRLAGLDVTVWSSDSKRAAGHLAKQGSPSLRWALYEAAMCAARQSAPDHAYYQSVKGRLNGKRAAITVARKLARMCYHTLRELGEEAMQPVADEVLVTAA